MIANVCCRARPYNIPNKKVARMCKFEADRRIVGLGNVSWRGASDRLYKRRLTHAAIAAREIASVPFLFPVP
jgi:hypothetical protein